MTSTDNRARCTLVLLLCLQLFVAGKLHATQAEPLTRDQILEKEAFSIGYQAYIWGFVYVKSMLLKEEAINPNYHTFTPINSIRSQKTLAKPGFTDFTPNNDTLYGLGWLDLSQGPILMTVPEIKDRYWTVQSTDYALNSLDYVGSRLKSKPGVYAYARSDWQGELPAGVTRIDSPTSTVFIQLRAFVNQNVDGDLEQVVSLNEQFKFRPLDPNAIYESVDKTVVIRDPKNTNPAFHKLEFFELLNEALTKDNPVPGEEAMFAQFTSLGIGPGMNFDENALSESQRRGLMEGQQAAFQRIMQDAKFGGTRLGSFDFRFGIGSYGHNFLVRSSVALMGYGANENIEALYTLAFVDKNGKPFTGANNYSLHFAADQLPPVDAFWSITMYRYPDNQLVENAIDRYNINNTTPGMKFNADGSLDIFIQHARPGGTKALNWLPAPEGTFWMVLRMYNPKPMVLEGNYIPPFAEVMSSSP